MTTLLLGMSQLITTLESIAEQCGEKIEKPADPKDEFLRVKAKMYALLSEVRENILERQALLKRRGQCLETIQRGHTVRQQLDGLKKALPQLQALHKKAQGKRNASKNREELQARYQDIRILKRHVDETSEMFLGTMAGNEESNTNLLRDAGMGSSAPPSLFGNHRAEGAAQPDCGPLSDEDRGEIDRLRARDAANDKMVDEALDAVERMKAPALQIGQVADHHAKLARDLSADAEKAEADLKHASKRVTDVMRYQKNTNLFCQMILGITLLCCLGFIAQQFS